MHADGRASRASYLVLPILLALGPVACAPGVSADAIAAQWSSTLSTGLQPGASTATVEAFLVSHGLTPDRTDAENAIFAVIPVEHRWYDLVTANILVKCRFDAGGRLTACSARARYTGP